MEKRIKIGDKQIKYITKISKRAKRIRLTVCRRNGLAAIRPYGLSEKIVERFIREKSKWVLSKLAHLKQFNNTYFLKDNREEYLKRKNEALKFSYERISHYNKIYNFNFNRICVKNQKTRWGSCSKKGNLNFNYKIVLLPIEMADYIIIHELCHLKELNHSPKFWNLVAKAAPNYLEIRKELKNESLKWY